MKKEHFKTKIKFPKLPELELDYEDSNLPAPVEPEVKKTTGQWDMYAILAGLCALIALILMIALHERTGFVLFELYGKFVLGLLVGIFAYMVYRVFKIFTEP